MDEVVTSRCACGWETRGREDDVVAATIDHGRRLHNMEATREQVMSAVTRLDDGVAIPDDRAETGRP